MSQREVRSPSYPQMSLIRCLDLLGLLYRGIHRGAVGNAEAQQIMGFAPRSGSGLAALSALKRFGLIEGRDPQIRITNLGFRFLEPIDTRERQEAIREAALKPQIFASMLTEFGGRLPADAVIRAKLIREHGFTRAGVDAFIKSLRETTSLIEPDEFSEVVAASQLPSESEVAAHPSGGVESPSLSPKRGALVESDGELLKFRVGPETNVTVSFSGPVTRESMLKLSRLIEVLSDGYEPADV